MAVSTIEGQTEYLASDITDDTIIYFGLDKTAAPKVSRKINLTELKKRINIQAIATLTVNDATPDVTGVSVAKTANTVATPYTNFPGGVEGHYLEIHVTEVYSSFVDGADIALAGGANVPVSSTPYRIAFRHNGTQWKHLFTLSEGHQIAQSVDGSNNLTLANTATDGDIDFDVTGSGAEQHFGVNGTDVLTLNATGTLGRQGYEAVTAGVGSPNVLTAAESGKLITNEGAGAKAYNTLPTATAGLWFPFYNQNANGTRITANTGDTIRLGNKVTAAAGYIETTTAGDYVVLFAINDTEWIGMPVYGTFTDGTFTFTLVTST